MRASMAGVGDGACGIQSVCAVLFECVRLALICNGGGCTHKVSKGTQGGKALPSKGACAKLRPRVKRLAADRLADRQQQHWLRVWMVYPRVVEALHTAASALIRVFSCFVAWSGTTGDPAGVDGGICAPQGRRLPDHYLWGVASDLCPFRARRGESELMWVVTPCGLH